MNPTKPGSVVSSEPTSETRRETLTVTDNRTGRQYEIPIKNDTIRSLDLRPIKVQADEFGMMDTIRRSRIPRRARARLLTLMATKEFCVIADIRSKSWRKKAPTWKRHT